MHLFEVGHSIAVRSIDFFLNNPNLKIIRINKTNTEIKVE